MIAYRRVALTSIVFILSILAGWLAGCEGGQEEPSGGAAGASVKHAPESKAARVEVATVRASQPVLHLIRPGEVRGAREAHLASALGGFVESVLVEAGERVAKNKPIAYVDSSTYTAQAKLTRIEVEDAERELKRLEQLGKSVAPARVDAARTRLERARAQHQLSKNQQARAVIRAPFAGVIVDLDIERGEVVAPGAPVARLIQLDPAHVLVSVADRDIALMSVGAKATVTSAGSPEPLEGTIHRIEPAADLQTRTFEVEVEVENADHKLLPGMIAKVSFANRREGDIVLLPQDFVVTRLDGNGVFVAGDDHIARWRPLTLGALIGTQVEVVSGLAPGDRVVTVGQRGLSDGDELIITRAGECCEDGRVVFEKSVRGPVTTEDARPDARQPQTSAVPAEATP